MLDLLEQVKRFIEVSHYFDEPWHWEVMCRLYLLILFSEKIILKTFQKTDDQREYVARKRKPKIKERL